MVKFCVWFLTGSVSNSVYVGVEHFLVVKETAQGTLWSGKGQANKLHWNLNLKIPVKFLNFRMPETLL